MKSSTLKNSSGPGRLFLLVAIAAALLVTGCTTYRPHPLSATPMPAKRLQDLDCTVQQQQQAGLQPHEINPADGLDLTEVAIIAVLNNPDL
ncbi:MAG TPA: hypothetical protein ENK89_06730, partial [Desulfobulbaceae bacterium]|nr:hypothetical protein [Desulfobulbaceae bacterium]